MKRIAAIMSAGKGPGFLGTVGAVLVALALWHVGVWSWRHYGWWSAGGAVALWLGLNLVNLVKFWFDGRRGLNQWPEPHGRYYDEWLRIREGAGDYYDWLANRMGHREPWRTWARLNRQVSLEREP